MASDRRPYPRPYLFEIVAVANLALIQLLASTIHLTVLPSLPGTFVKFASTLLGYAVAGVVVRGAVAAVRGQWRSYLRHIRNPGWITDTLRLVIFGALTMQAYFWIKLLVPLLHDRSFDQQLWDLDQALLIGYSPNILFIDLFSQPAVMRTIDWTYARIFFASMTVAFVYFLSLPNRRLRVAFTTGNSIMWLAGAWLYMLFPSLGPAYRFPELWLPLADGLPMTQHFQALLMRNYQKILRLPHEVSPGIQLAFGIAAFPSLHVGFQTYAFLWMRRLWIWGEIVFGIFMLLIVIGSVVTGWHYLLDGVAGAALAAASYWISSRLWRIPRWRALRRARGSEIFIPAAA